MKAAARKALAEKLKRKGVRQPYVVIDEATRANILVASALAMLQMETGDHEASPSSRGFELDQQNIFGCDHGPARAFCHLSVTKDRVAALRASQLANGVGWTQLTYPPFVAQADREGGAHIPRFQMRVGFAVLRDLFDAHHSLQLMFEKYNGSGSAAVAYGRKAVALRLDWLKITGGK